MKVKTKKILDILKETYPDAKCELNYETPFQLLVATVLSAQTTDKKVNEVTKDLFSKYPDLDSFLDITSDELEERIKKIGLYRNKTKNILMMVRQIKENFNGEVPNTMEGITSLAGAGRKTANVVLSNAFGVPSIAVDTHVKRVSIRLNIAKHNDDLLTIEKKLNKYFKNQDLSRIHHQLVLFGRYYCKAIKPECMNCKLKDMGKYYKKSKKR